MVTADSAAFADPRPDDVRRALQRLLVRWRQLPVEDAERHSAAVHALAQHFVDLISGPAQSAQLPVLGPAVVIDQLWVAAYDACAAARVSGCAEQLRGLLAQLR